MHRRARRTPRAHLQQIRSTLARKRLLHRTCPRPPRASIRSNHGGRLLNQNKMKLQHMLSLPMFAFMPTSVRRGFVGLSRPNKSHHGVNLGDAVTNSMSSMSSTSKTGTGIHPYTILALNLITQLVCVSGVNQLSSVSHPSPVTFCTHAHTSPTSSPPLRGSLPRLSLFFFSFFFIVTVA